MKKKFRFLVGYYYNITHGNRALYFFNMRQEQIAERNRILRRNNQLTQ